MHSSIVYVDNFRQVFQHNNSFWKLELPKAEAIPLAISMTALLFSGGLFKLQPSVCFWDCSLT